MAIEPNDILIGVLAFRRQPCRELQDWLDAKRSQGMSIVYAPEDLDIPTVRNRLAELFLGTDKAYLLMVDADTVPQATSQCLLSVLGDVIYLGIPTHAARKGHYGNDSFGCGMCRVSRRALETIGRPWFANVFDARGVRVKCACTYFGRKAAQAGLSPRMVGVAGHKVEAVAFFDAEGNVRLGVRGR